jgi:sugar (pentulose or hexulose) kinase
MPDHDADALAMLLGLRARHPGARITRAGTSTWVATIQTSPTASRVIAAHSLPRLAERLEAAKNDASGVTWLPSQI